MTWNLVQASPHVTSWELAQAEEEDPTSLGLVQGERGCLSLKTFSEESWWQKWPLWCVPYGDFPEKCMESDLLQNVLETWGVAGEIQAEVDSEYQITPFYLVLLFFYSLYAFRDLRALIN